VDEERELTLFSLMLAQADPGTAAVLADELDARASSDLLGVAKPDRPADCFVAAPVRTRAALD
jgi:hypothetical protein